MESRRVGNLLFAAGLALLVLTVAVAPPPVGFGDAVAMARDGGGGAEGLRVAARDPQLGDGVVTRYDADTGTTLVVFGCDHEYCGTAVRVEGDARGAFDGGPYLLRALGEGPLTLEPLAEPIVLDAERDRVVTRVLAPTFEQVPLWPGLTGFAVAVSLLVIAVPFVLRTRPYQAWSTAVPGLAAVGFGVIAASAGPLLLLLSGGAVLLGALALMGRVFFERGKWIALMFELAAIAFLATSWTLRSYFPGAPAV